MKPIHPIFMTDRSVQESLAGRKTQTRRVVKWPCRKPSTAKPSHDEVRRVALRDGVAIPFGGTCGDRHYLDSHAKCLYGVPGHWLWFRETWRPVGVRIVPLNAMLDIEYRADRSIRWRDPGPVWFRKIASDQGFGPNVKWRPPVFMPKWACIRGAEVTGVRVERLQDITEEDALAEGAKAHGPGLCTEDPDKYHGCWSARTEFSKMWDTINAKRGFSWSMNPWVWVVSYRMLSEEETLAMEGVLNGRQTESAEEVRS